MIGRDYGVDASLRPYRVLASVSPFLSGSLPQSLRLQLNFTNVGADDNTISYWLKITGRNCLDWKPGLNYCYW